MRRAAAVADEDGIADNRAKWGKSGEVGSDARTGAVVNVSPVSAAPISATNRVYIDQIIDG